MHVDMNVRQTLHDGDAEMESQNVGAEDGTCRCQGCGLIPDLAPLCNANSTLRRAYAANSRAMSSASSEDVGDLLTL